MPKIADRFASFRILVYLIFSIVSTAVNVTPAFSTTIQEELQRRAPEIIDFLVRKNLKTIGVLKFRVQPPGGAVTDKAGTINSMLADRFEVALILANPFDEQLQLNIIRDANSQLASNPRAHHLSKEGRLQFFGAEYQPAWGKKLLDADAFLTGIVQVHENRKNATVGILYFDKTGERLERIGDPFEVTLDASATAELGESFVLRGAFDEGKTALTNDPAQLQTLVVEAAKRVRQQDAPFPIDDAKSPVRLEVRYDGKPVQIVLKDGQAFLPEPQSGQRVEIVINRTPAANGTLGVVVKVNGENTLYRQTSRDIECAKWLLTENHTQTTIKGFQLRDSNRIERFVVLSEQDSAERAMDYGHHVGQIQMVVFKERSNAKIPRVSSEADEDLNALMRGFRPSQPPQNLDALKEQIRVAARSSDSTRGGLIVAGDQAKNEGIELKTFQPDPTPIMSVTLSYYKQLK